MVSDFRSFRSYYENRTTCLETLIQLVTTVNILVFVAQPVSLEPSCYRQFTHTDTFRTLAEFSK